MNKCSVKKSRNKNYRPFINFMLFVPCIVIQLRNVNQQMYTLQINVLIQFLASSSCFDHHVFIIKKTICTCSFVWYVFLYICKQYSRWKDVLNTSFHLLDCLPKCMINIPHKTACTNGLLDEEHMMIETWR